jgi:transcriptional regulator with XRE-family HTH domain/ribosomal protein S27E
MAHTALDPFEAEASVVVPPTLYALRREGSSESPEGLLSWVVGLAHAHCLGPRTLVKYLLEQSERHADFWSDTAFFERHCATVNGLGRYALTMLDALGRPSPSKAQCMTLLGLAHLLPFNGEGLLARNPRWCPACLCDQARKGQRAHHPLVWSFEHYRVCHVHQGFMSERCPACGAEQAFLPIYPSLLHCNACGESMIVRPPGSADLEVASSHEGISAFDRWSASALVDLVSRIPELQRAGSLAQMQQNLVDLAASLTQGNRKGLCEALGLQPRAINGWLNKDERPSLGLLLRFCHGLNLLPADLFLANDAIRHAERPKPAQTPSSDRQERPMLGYRQREMLQRQLDLILETPSDYRGLAAVAHQLGLTRHALKYWFPGQSKEIVLKRRMAESRTLERRYQADHEYLQQVLTKLVASRVYPSRRKVERMLSQRQLSLMRPDLYTAYRRRLMSL